MPGPRLSVLMGRGARKRVVEENSKRSSIKLPGSLLADAGTNEGSLGFLGVTVLILTSQPQPEECRVQEAARPSLNTNSASNQLCDLWQVTSLFQVSNSPSIKWRK